MLGAIIITGLIVALVLNLRPKAEQPGHCHIELDGSAV